MGGILLAMGGGVVRTFLATGTVLESTAGIFLRVRSDINVLKFTNLDSHIYSLTAAYQYIR